MTESAPHILWTTIGSPVVVDCYEGSGLCYQCAGPVVRGLSIKDWMSSNYTDQNRVRCPNATHVCEACVMLSRRLWAVPGRPPGKCNACSGTGKITKLAKKGSTKHCAIGDACPKCEGSGDAAVGGNWRNYGHLVELGWDSPAFAPVKDDEGHVIALNGPPGLGYINASKGDKDYIRGFLSREHEGVWFAAIADSGQKHVVPWAPLNAPGKAGDVLFDELLVSVPKDQSLIDAVSQLLTDGATKDEILTGDYRSATWMRCPSSVSVFEEMFATQRGSPWFTLAVWLAQRDEQKVQERLQSEKESKTNAKRVGKQQGKTVRESNGGVHSGRQKRVCGEPKGKGETGLLGQDPGYDPRRGANNNHSQRTSDECAKRLADPRTGQIRLPGFD